METPKEENEQILDSEEFKINYNNDYIRVLIAKSEDNIIIRSSYYEISFTRENLFILTKIKFSSIDDSYEFIKRSFNKNKVSIKKMSSKCIILIITYNINNKEKQLEIYLNENLENTNNLIKKLFNDNIKLEKEISKIKETNKNIIEENNNLKQDLENIKDKYNNDIMS